MNGRKKAAGRITERHHVAWSSRPGPVSPRNAFYQDRTRRMRGREGLGREGEKRPARLARERGYTTSPRAYHDIETGAGMERDQPRTVGRTRPPPSCSPRSGRESGIVFNKPHEAATQLDEMEERRFDPRVGIPRFCASSSSTRFRPPGSSRATPSPTTPRSCGRSRPPASGSTRQRPRAAPLPERPRRRAEGHGRSS